MKGAKTDIRDEWKESKEEVGLLVGLLIGTIISIYTFFFEGNWKKWWTSFTKDDYTYSIVIITISVWVLFLAYKSLFSFFSKSSQRANPIVLFAVSLLGSALVTSSLFITSLGTIALAKKVFFLLIVWN
jgi:hypothetical protein